MTPGELVAVIEDADVRAPSGRRRVILELHAPTVLGQTGKYLGTEEVNVGTPLNPVIERRAVFGYTRRQCYAMRDAIYEAARADLGSEPG